MTKQKLYSVEVRFKNSPYQTYHYMSDIKTLKKDDTVVVDTPRSGYEVVKVVSVKDLDPAQSIATKFIVDKVSVKKYAERLQTEKRKKEIQQKLDVMTKEVEKMVVYETLAKSSDEFAELLKELKELG